MQRHEARRLHYDVRLERHGALASWAVPKGVPLEPGAKALAVHVEDHPLSYGSFHGEIPQGQYGAGRVEIWDKGTYELLEEKPNGQLTFALRGKRLRGTWSLVPAHLDGKEQNWLLVKVADERAAPAPVRSYAPMLATAHEGIPRGGDWVFEVKFDGYRTLAYIRNGECRLVSRNQKDLTERFAEIAREVVKAVKSPDAVLDGEVCRLDATGRSSFSELQQGSGALVLYAFDLLELDGVPLVDLPLAERKGRLRKLLDAGNPAIRFSDDFDDGEALFVAAGAQGLEGIVAKRASSRYTPGARTRDWLKLKLHHEQEFVIVGYTRGTGHRGDTFGALVLGENEGGRLRYVGNVGTGFGDAEITRLLKLLKPLQRTSSPLAETPKLPRARAADIQWVEPKLVAQVRFTEWTTTGTSATQLSRPPGRQDRSRGDRGGGDRGRADPECAAPGQARASALESRQAVLARSRITKGDLLAYYRAVAPVLVPHLRDRPFTMRRYPDGAFGRCSSRRTPRRTCPTGYRLPHARHHPRQGADETVDRPAGGQRRARTPLDGQHGMHRHEHVVLADRQARPPRLRPLRPRPDTRHTVEEHDRGRADLKDLLDQLGLASFPKTSGGKGFHVLVPLDRRSTYDDTRSFAELVAGAIEQTHPKLATTEWAKARRRGVLIDANQNGQGKTIASAYSVRPNAQASVSTPLTWDEVGDGVDPAAYSMSVVLERVQTLGDLHAGLRSTRQSLSRALSQLS